jgi:ribosome-associated protein|tara:strand:- start:245 stop:592 length:348 start_codon:yes stop_codon:yes gene_type:complete
MVQKSNSSKQIKDLCASALDELKAKNINIFEVEKISSFASYILIGTGTSNRHIQSIARKVIDNLKDNKIKVLGTEGTESNEWILIDVGDVLVNIMTEDSRDHYDLESLWNRAKSD